MLTADQWDVWTDPRPMLDDCEKHDRKLRLFACACVRRVWDRLPNDASRRAVELAERYADEGLALEAERQALRAECEALLFAPTLTPETAGSDCLDTSAALAAASCSFAAAALETTPAVRANRETVRAKQADLLREIFGNPLRPPVRVEPEWLAWNGGTVPLMANRIYDTRAFGDLPVLADALEDAGCTNAMILAHLRGPNEHVRGCWALDLLRDAPAPT